MQGKKKDGCQQAAIFVYENMKYVLWMDAKFLLPDRRKKQSRTRT